jgi:DNA-binding NarL/FixJ family response regulator
MSQRAAIEAPSAIQRRRHQLGTTGSQLDAPQQIRIVVADDHPTLRDGLRRLVELENDLAIVGEAANGERALELVRELDPDILLLDVSMPKLSGLEVLRRLAAEKSRVRTLLFTAGIDRSEMLQALELGARGVILKDSPTQLLFKGIRGVMDGQHWVGRETVSDLVDSLVQLRANPPATKSPFGLTPRERETLALIVSGYGNKEAAKQLSVREDTIKHHLTSIFNKTGASNRLELALFALNHRLVGNP